VQGLHQDLQGQGSCGDGGDAGEDGRFSSGDQTPRLVQRVPYVGECQIHSHIPITVINVEGGGRLSFMPMAGQSMGPHALLQPVRHPPLRFRRPFLGRSSGGHEVSLALRFPS
jgi:hypothetical protein